MIRCPQCGMDNNDGTPNCWKCGYPLDNIEAKEESHSKEEVEKEVIEEKRISDDKKRANSDSISKKIALIPLFAVIILLVRANIRGINLLGLFSGKGLHENFPIICLSILFVGLLICVCLMGLIPLIRKETFNESIPVKKRHKILKTINKFNSASKLYSQNEVSYKEVVMSNTFNIVLIPVILVITFGSLVYPHMPATIINCVLSVITVIIGILVYIFPEKLNNYLKEDIRSPEGYAKLFVVAHLPIIFLLIMIVLNI